MSLRFELCACLLHGRFLGDRGIPMEVGSREMAKAMLEQADANGVLGPGDRGRIEEAVAKSMMVVKDDWIDDELRRRIMLWNLAAASTNDPKAFETTGFHDYHALVDGFGHDDPQPS
ncbi:MAG TPA: hypothetical protein VJ694_04360 [Patescibacteria group bacterium]|nr:hypothetical protein [Patescibacteria group bacterium]